ncbi:hypothetical protein PoB_005633500 [Plakobranchus ocellatus]|uniref:Uncharacterized protein n=1 Tax=Plakobranchus ocellatus TaxID=259542 RepID=A0AAV4CAS2_9GAST|nr:hypothetical protein PoB_005633500 [Plakobranchus ocellatus]
MPPGLHVAHLELLADTVGIHVAYTEPFAESARVSYGSPRAIFKNEDSLYLRQPLICRAYFIWNRHLHLKCFFLMHRLRDFFSLKPILLQFIRESKRNWHSESLVFFGAQDRSVVHESLQGRNVTSIAKVCWTRI